MFVDVAAGATDGLETRIYHEESGLEVVFPGAEPERWMGWILDRISETGDARSPADRSPAAVVGSGTEIDVETEVGTRSGADRLSCHVHLILGLGSPDIEALEQEIGAALVDAVVDAVVDALVELRSLGNVKPGKGSHGRRHR